MKNVPPSEKLRKEIDEILSGQLGKDEDLLGLMIDRSLKMMFQKILEQEVKDYLGRDYYERGAGSRKGYRNGYEPKRLKTAEGEINLEAPQLRETEETYRSDFLNKIDFLSPQLKQLVLEMYARGLSTRDVEEALRDKRTGKSLLSKDGVSDLTEEFWGEYERFCERDLAGFDLVYMFADAVYESLREQSGMKEAILCCWGITSGGHKVMLHIGLGNKESFNSWLEFFRHMVKRGLRIPLLVVSDGAPGLIKAIAECFPDSKRQRCLFHKISNIRNKLPNEAATEVLTKVKSVYYQVDQEIAKVYAAKIIDDYADKYPSAIKCFQEDFEACTQYMFFPAGHHKQIRTTNLLERAFLEQRRRTKIIPRFFDEKSCLKLVYATMLRVSEKWRRVTMNEYDLVVLKKIKKLYGWEEEKNGYISKEAVA